MLIPTSQGYTTFYSNGNSGDLGVMKHKNLENFGVLRHLNAQKCHTEPLRMAEGTT